MTRSGSKQKQTVAFADHQIGEIVKIDTEGRAHVRVEGSSEFILARSVLDAGARIGDSPEHLIGAPVLLLFENGDPALPIIVGLIRETLRPEPAVAEFKLDAGKSRDVLVDGRRLVLDAQQEILLRCGKSTILLQRDGKVLVRGAHLVSRSSGPNKIKGGSISLN